MRLGDDLAARADLDAALAADGIPSSQRAAALSVRARLRLRVRDFEGLVADITQAIAVAPELSFLYAQRAVARWHLRQLDAAVQDADAAVDRASAPGARLVFRAVLHHERREWDRVEADATAALELGSGADSLPWRAVARLRAGRLDDALADARMARRLDPAGTFPLWVRAVAHARDGVAAIADLRRLRRLDPWGRSSSAAISLAVGAYFDGEHDRARRLLRDARDHEPRPERPALWLSLLLGADDPLPEPREGWPGALGRFGRGELKIDGLLERAATLEDAWQDEAERRSEALCFAGLRRERDGAAEEARRWYRACVDEGVVASTEHLWATLRLAGVEPRPPRPAPPTPTAAAPVRAAVPTSSLADQLERLARLRAQGVLNDEEFALARRRILGL